MLAGGVNGLCVVLCARSQSLQPSMNGKMCWIKCRRTEGMLRYRMLGQAGRKNGVQMTRPTGAE